MSKIMSRTEVTRTEDADGNIKITEKKSTTAVERSSEPDYIKIYTRMWCEFNQIPSKWRELFMQLVVHMSYAVKTDLSHSQTVVVYGGTSADICAACGWKDKSTLRKGLKVLCDCGAIRRTQYRATYQINPSYAGRGSWKYDPKHDTGGIEDLVATFSFKAGTVDTRVIWADDGTDNNLNQLYREGLQTDSRDTVLSETTIKQTATEAHP